jgi:hypothetical protein
MNDSVKDRLSVVHVPHAVRLVIIKYEEGKGDRKKEFILS